MILIPARAKVNLCLTVRGRRPDGFHDIDSVAVTVDWHDLIGLRLRPALATSVRLRLTGVDGVPPGDDNLAVQAVQAAAALAGPFAAEVWLHKRVPGAAGLGGGSADAAAVLRACALLTASGVLGPDRVHTFDGAAVHGLAASLGSDVPMVLAGATQRMQGRGELLAAVAVARPLHLTVAVVGTSSTAASYAALEAFDFEDASRVDAVAAALAAGERPGDDLLGSGLEAAACRVNPDLDERLLALRAALPEVRWHLTGSGGAAFALSDDAAAAAELAAAARDSGFHSRACRGVGG